VLFDVKILIIMKNGEKIIKRIFVLAVFLFVVSLLPAPQTTNAGIIDDLKSKISGRAGEIEKLEQEIAEYQEELAGIGKEKASLQKEVRTLDVTRRKLSTDIKVTQNKVEASSFNIEKLSIEIGGKEEDIVESIDVIKATIRRINEIESNTLAELVLSSENMSELWNEIDTFQQFQTSMEERVRELQALKTNLESDRTEIEQERSNQLALKSKLSDQKKIVDNNRSQQNALLSQTKNKESNYQAQLEERLRLKEEFERELLDLEAQLQIAIDPDSLPPAGKGILRWPLDKVRLTQYFGNTKFAQSGAYNGRGHNGIDFGISTGTEVKAALSGTVVETGNTDLYKGCYSYGKWVLVKHNNGLSTMYAHLSLIKATAGQVVSTGDVIGYSGNTGYSTGPHLHFTVYASQGVEVVRLGDIKKITNCGNARIPVAPFNAYLNPLDYL